MTTVKIELHRETAEKIIDIVSAVANTTEDINREPFSLIMAIIEELIKEKPVPTDSMA